MVCKPPNCVFELVSDLIETSSGQWNPAALHDAFPTEIAQRTDHMHLTW